MTDTLQMTPLELAELRYLETRVKYCSRVIEDCRKNKDELLVRLGIDFDPESIAIGEMVYPDPIVDALLKHGYTELARQAYALREKVAVIDAAKEKLRRERVLRQKDPGNERVAAIEKLKQSRADFISTTNELSRLVTSIEKRLGIKLRDYGYDDETGELTWIDQ